MPQVRPCVDGPHDGRNAVAAKDFAAYLDGDGRAFNRAGPGRALYRRDGGRWCYVGHGAYLCRSCNALVRPIEAKTVAGVFDVALEPDVRRA